MRASLLVLDNSSSQLILIKRLKKGRTYFVLPGGTVEEGESFRQAALREIKEELDLDLSEEMLIASQETDDGQVFLVRSELSPDSLIIHGEELARSDEDNCYQPLWMPLSEAKKLTFFPQIDIDSLLEVTSC